MRPSSAPEPLTVPLRYPTSTIFIDESGSKSTANRCFVVAAVKLREPGRLARRIRHIRDSHDFQGEFKFGRVSRDTLPAFFDLVDELAASDAHLAACTVDGSVYNPFRGSRKAVWRVHAEITSQLLVGCINRRELVGVCLDGISTPPNDSLEETVRKLTNDRLKSTSIVSSVALDSKTSDLLQAADIVAGSIFHERMRTLGGETKPRSHRGKVALRLASAFERPGLADGRDSRVNIDTYRARPATIPGLAV